MKVHEWIKKMVDAGFTCDAYTGKLNSSVSKKDIIDVCLDANGITFLCDMQAKGFPLPYENILREYGAYINGRYKAVYKDENGKQLYTSCMYIGVDTSIVVDTTVTVLFDCKGVVEVPADKHAILVLGYGSDISINNNAENRLVSWGKVLGRGDYKYKFIKDGREEELL